MLNLVKQLIADGVPIDGVGFQCHFIVGEVPTSFQTVLEQFTALGLEVAITELDIRTTTPASQSALAQQQKDFQSVVQACMNVEKCVGITVWDFTDKYSWIPGVFAGEGQANLYDEDYQPKSAYAAVQRDLDARTRELAAKNAALAQLRATVTAPWLHVDAGAGTSVPHDHHAAADAREGEGRRGRGREGQRAGDGAREGDEDDDDIGAHGDAAVREPPGLR